MPGEKAQNLQDSFLNHVRKQKVPVTIFLVNGVKLQGVITWFDNFCLLLRRDAQSQLVYKHAISTIMPAQPVQLYEPSDDEMAEPVDGEDLLVFAGDFDVTLLDRSPDDGNRDPARPT